ncbi:MAG: hypothetical protein WC211_01305 [Dehalococcoidia bacterium]
MLELGMLAYGLAGAAVGLACGAGLVTWAHGRNRYRDALAAALHPAAPYRLDYSDVVLLLQGGVVGDRSGRPLVTLSADVLAHPEHLMVAVRARMTAQTRRAGR